MQASIADEIAWRLTLYRNIFAFCEQGQFSFARFLALIPDRLRLAVGESIAKAQIPVLLEPGVIEECTALLPAWQAGPVQDPASLTAQVEPASAAPTGALDATMDQLRRAIRSAQIHGNLDVLRVAAWLSERGDAFLKMFGGLYLKGLGEIGHGEGGEETAYLVHLLILHVLRQALHKQSQEPGPHQQAFLSSALSMALQGALASEAFPDEALSARLGFQCAVTGSPFALGAQVQPLIQSPLNSYRTSPEAVELMKAQVQGPAEKLDLNLCVNRVAEQLLTRALTRANLAREVLYELVRDCMLLSVLKLYRSPPAHLFKALHRLASSTSLLAQYVTDPTRRGQLIHWIDVQPSAGEQPLPTLRKLLVEGERPLLGSTQPLRVHGDVRKRAQLAATGALLLLLDQKVSQFAGELISRVRFVSAKEQPNAYEDGRCYRLALDAKPLYELPKVRQEAQLFVDLKDFTKRTASIKEQAMGDFLKRYFYEPIFELAAKLKGNSAHVLSVVNILGDAVAFRGEITAIVSLALGVRRILAQAEQELTTSISDVLGGDASTSEIDAEIAQVRTELGRVESQIEGALPMLNGGTNNAAEQRKRLLAQLAMLEEARSQRRAKSVGLGLEAGAYISFGAAAERVDLSHPSLGPWAVTIGERLNEAARGTARSPQVKAERDAAVAGAREERKSPQLELPFQVRVGKSYQLQLQPRHTEELESAIHRLDKNAVTGSVRDFAQWLHQHASEAIDRQEGGLPACISRSEEFYNAGCALSGPALDAFEKATQRSLIFKRMEIYHAQLPAEFHRKHLLEFDPERLVLVSDPATAAPVHLLRYTGKALFKGFENQGAIDVWELLLPDAGFGRDLLSALQGSSREQTPRKRAAGEAAR